MLYSIPQGFVPLEGWPNSLPVGRLFVRSRDATLGFCLDQILQQAKWHHGGWLGAFLDMQMLFTASTSGCAGDEFLTTVNLSVEYLAPVREGDWIEGRAHLIGFTSELISMKGSLNSSGVEVLRGHGLYKMPTHEVQ
jgi:hypothetical protein